MSVPVVVVVPETTTERAKALIRQEEAEVIVHGASWQEANALAQSMLTDSDAFLHPFDDPLLWQGHASMIDEVKRAGIEPDAVVLSVGGGGLLSGVAEGLGRNGWGEVPIVAAETIGADSFAQSIDAGERVELPRISSIATSLGARKVCEQAFRWSQERAVRSVVVPDRAAASACRRFVDDHRIVTEPACGAALAVLYDNLPVLENSESVLVIVCGGSTATIEDLQGWL
jgi:L-serine/L-threonine ammonia-lyase